MEEEAKVTKKRLMPAEQDRQIAEEIAEAGVLLATIEADPEIQTALAEYGTDAAEIATGRTLESAAQDGMTPRPSKHATPTSARSAGRGCSVPPCGRR